MTTGKALNGKPYAGNPHGGNAEAWVSTLQKPNMESRSFGGGNHGECDGTHVIVGGHAHMEWRRRQFQR